MALQGPVDRGYLNLLAHLRGDKLRVSQDTLQAALCYYLVHLPPTQPTPTPLTASVISSSVWLPLSLKTCLTLGNTFRISVRNKLSELSKKKRGLFDASLSSDLTSWLYGILAGLKDGAPLLRMSASGGILLGVNDLKDSKLSRRIFRDVEETVILPFAEAVEEASGVGNEWTDEFAHSKDDLQDRVNLPVLLASRYFSLISAEALSALNLPNLASHCLSVFEKGFASGNYLHDARESLIRGVNASIMIPEDSSLGCNIDALTESDAFTAMPFLCRLLARVVGILANTSFRPQKKKELWELLNNTAQKLQSLSRQTEDDWRSSPLADVHSDGQLEEGLRKVTEKVWTVLKTYLFSTLMLQQAILDTILFHVPPSTLPKSSSTSHLTSTILETLSSLSFIIASFGGVLAGSTEKGPSFSELKKAFYTSIDILSTDVAESEALVFKLVRDANDCDIKPPDTSKSPFTHAKHSFVLACIEQFIPVLNDSCIEEVVLPFCEPHLEDLSNRQTYESAHSVMLSIFAAHAERSATTTSLQQKDAKGKAVEKRGDTNLARRLVPGYAQTLLENAREGGLTTAQLRLAYAALVRSASTGRSRSRNPSLNPPTSSPPLTYRWWKSSEMNDEFSGDPALAWFCIEQLLHALSSSSSMGSHQTHQALSLTLISLIPNISFELLPRVLAEVERVIDSETEQGKRRVLIENTFEEILERVGDGEREIAMMWWFEMAKKWDVSGDNRVDEQESAS